MDGGRAGGQPATVGTVREIWRYPVKSMAGERLDRTEIGGTAIAGGLSEMMK
jgi:uncharacterized protein YcbX